MHIWFLGTLSLRFLLLKLDKCLQQCCQTLLIPHRYDRSDLVLNLVFFLLFFQVRPPPRLHHLATSVSAARTAIHYEFQSPPLSLAPLSLPSMIAKVNPCPATLKCSTLAGLTLQNMLLAMRRPLHTQKNDRFMAYVISCNRAHIPHLTFGVVLSTKMFVGRKREGASLPLSGRCIHSFMMHDALLSFFHVQQFCVSFFFLFGFFWHPFDPNSHVYGNFRTRERKIYQRFQS